MGAGSQGLQPTEGVFDRDIGDAGVDKQEPGGVEVEDPDADIRGGATPADEDFAPTDDVAGINFGGPDFPTDSDEEEENGGAEETAAGLDTLSIEARGVDNVLVDAGREEEEGPTDRCLDPAGDVSVTAEVGGLRPCFIRGGEESLGGAAGDGAEDTLGGIEICGGADSTSGDDSIGGPGADVGHSETAGPVETRGGVESVVDSES